MRIQTTKGILDYDIDDEGGIKMENPQTIDTYKQIRDEQPSTEEYEVFFAFTNKRFEEEEKKLIARGITTKLYRGPVAGMFGTRQGILNFLDFYKKKDQRYRELCDPQEIYFYEYNNYESMYGSEGDIEAICTIINIFGEKVAKKIKRYSAYHTLEYAKSIC